MKNLVGRKKEIEYLQEIVDSGEPEFVVVYGRRRVGKTFLVKQFFKGKFTFYFSGSEKAKMRTQLKNFRNAYTDYFGIQAAIPDSWTTAFQMLKDTLKSSKKKGRKIIFIDEVPWLASSGSSFIQAFEYWWNTYASFRTDIVLIICGSSTSWIINKILKNRGGLHNRVTRQISLQPFTLKECEEFARKQELDLDRKEILDYYMIFGGVPYYWKHIHTSKSLPQNIDNLFFNNNSILENEFTEIYNSLFAHSEKYILLIISLGKKRIGLTRAEIIKISGLSDGGSITRMLEELEQCGFIRSYFGFGKKSKYKIYQLIDLFSLFYLSFKHNQRITDEQFWANNYDVPRVNSWRGYAFEQVGLWHIPQIKQKLGISGVSTAYSSWRSSDKEFSAQIDLVIERNDNVVNLCEMKYSNEEFTIDKDLNERLRKQKAAFQRETKSKKTIHTTMITLYGVKKNRYKKNIQSEVIMNDLYLL